MDLLVIVMLLSAALLHASWHAMIKASSDRLIGLAGMNVVSTGVSLAVLPLIAIPRAEIWPILAFSVVLHNVYKGSLAQVYRHGDLSQAYPIARGMSPLFATLIALIALGEVPSGWQLTGIALTSGGLIVMGTELVLQTTISGLSPLRDFTAANIDCVSCPSTSIASHPKARYLPTKG